MPTELVIKSPRCPRCGGQGKTVAQQSGEDVVDTWAECTGCGAKTDAYEDFKSDEYNHRWAANEFAKGRFV